MSSLQWMTKSRMCPCVCVGEITFQNVKSVRCVIKTSRFFPLVGSIEMKVEIAHIINRLSLMLLLNSSMLVSSLEKLTCQLSLSGWLLLEQKIRRQCIRLRDRKSRASSNEVCWNRKLNEVTRNKIVSVLITAVIGSVGGVNGVERGKRITRK